MKQGLGGSCLYDGKIVIVHNSCQSANQILEKGGSSVNNKTESMNRNMPEAASSQMILRTKRGRTTFLIKLHFADHGKETVEDKTKQCITQWIQQELSES